MTECEMIKLLQSSGLFAEVDCSCLSCTFASFRKGQMIDAENCVKVIVKGRVDVYSMAVDGTEIQLNTLAEGNICGISNIFSACRVNTILKCSQNTSLILISKENLKRLFQSSPVFAARYAAFCNDRIQFLLSRIETLTIQSAKVKLSEFLYKESETSHEIRLQFSKEQLAKALGISRAALFRELADMQTRQLIKVDHMIITILNREGVKRQLLAADS